MTFRTDPLPEEATPIGDKEIIKPVKERTIYVSDDNSNSMSLIFRFKVHMKRFFTVVFHFIIVKMNIKESYIT